MSPDDFRAALAELGLTQVEAAELLAVSSGRRVSDWCTGRRRVPDYVAAHVRTLRRLQEAGEPLDAAEAQEDAVDG